MHFKHGTAFDKPFVKADRSWLFSRGMKMHLTKYSMTESIYDNNSGAHVALLLNTKNGTQLAVDSDSFEHIRKSEFARLPVELFSLLKQHDFLTELSPEQELAHIINENQIEDSKSEVLHIVLQPSSWCQLGCTYCGQAHVKNGRLNKELIVKFIRDKIDYHNPKKLVISWFGSEPLTTIESILVIGEEIKNFCKSQGIEMISKMSTNGVNLTPKNVQLLAEKVNCHQFEVTLDGIAEYHDKRRYTKYKGKSFAVIYQNLQQVLNNNHHKIRISIRCNVDAENREGVLPLIQKLHADGLHKKILYFYTIPVHSWGNDAHLRSSSLQEFANWEMQIIMEMIRLNFPITLLPGRNKQLCLSSFKSGYLVDPNGEVFGCTEVSLVPSYEQNGKNIHRLGNIMDSNAGDLLNQNRFSDFYDEVKQGKYGCGDCYLLPICGGRCPKEWAEGRAACPPLKMNIRDKMILKYLMSKKYFPHQQVLKTETTQEIHPV